MRVARLLTKWLALAGLLATPMAAAHGQVQEHRLTEADARFPESFSTVRGLRELRDGQLLIADGLGQALMVVNFDRGVADTIGRVGGGPNEYRTPDALFSLPGDSTLLVDLGNGRLTVLGPDLAFGETFPIAMGGGGPGGMSIRIPRGVDSQGRIFYQEMGGPRGGRMPDSAAVMRWDRSADETELITRVKLQERKVQESGGINNRNVSVQAVPLSPRDGWAVSWEGRVAAARSIDYHIDWIDANGDKVSGTPIDYRPVSVGSGEKQDWLSALGSDGLSVSVDINNGRRQTSFSRGGPSRRQRSVDDYEWPEHMPAFDAARIRVDTDGMAWVQRYTKSGAEPMFDVFDANGTLVKHVTFPKGRRVVGFGKGVVYTTVSDEFDLQWLERFKL